MSTDPRSLRDTFRAPLFVLLAAASLVVTAPRAVAQQTFTGGGGITVSGSSTTASGSSTLNVSGATGSTVATVKVQLNGVTSDGTNNSMYGSSFVLKSPNGTQFVLLGSTGDSVDGDDAGDSGSGLSGVTINVQDGASAAPNYATAWPHTGSITVKPSSYWKYDIGSLPLSGVLYPANDGSSTLTGAFTNAPSDGLWTLTIQNSVYATPVSISSWALTLTYATVSLSSTTTSLSPSANPATTGNNVTFTATVLSTGTPVNSGTVAFTANGTTISGCSSVPLSSGTATCTTAASGLGQGISAIKATYSGNSTYSSSSGNLTELVEATASHTSDTWCNNNSMSMVFATPPQAYPSIIHVTGYNSGATVSNVSVQLKNISWSGSPAQHLLVAPGGTQNLDFWDDEFAYQNSTISPITLTLSDNGSTPTSSGTPTGGTYVASDGNVNFPTWPTATAPSIDSNIPQVPGTINFAPPIGSTTQTFLKNFNGASANGDWSLYNYYGFSSNETLAGGWCITLTVNTGVGTTTKITSSANPGLKGNAVTLTATVKETVSGNPVTTGSVTFTENNSAPAGTVSGNNVVALNSNGQATFTSNALSEGDHQIVATYAGTAAENPSQDVSFWQRIDNATLETATSGQPVSFCNSNAVGTTGVSQGPAIPNPSNIFVTGLPGTVKTVTLGLKGATSSAITQLQSLVKGPTGAALDFFSNTGNTSAYGTFGTGDYVFDDSAAGVVGTGNVTPGSYKPTSYQSVSYPNDTFTSSSSGFYAAPGSFNYSAPRASSTFTSTFGSTAPNGTWSLFFDEKSTGSGGFNAANGWCLNFTTNSVTGSVSASHAGTSGAGSDFVQGESNATITAVVTNNGTGSTGDPTGSSPMKVTDTLNSKLTFVNTGTGTWGTGWSCAAASQVVTCTNDSSVAQGSNYPTLTFAVNVSPTATASISNTVSASGAGMTTATSAADTINVSASPALSLSMGQSGTFTQGSTAQWTVTVNNGLSAAATSGTITVTDTLPSGYTLNGSSSTAGSWGCAGSGTSVTCTSSASIAAGGSETIYLTVNVPANSPTSVVNSAQAYGGGDAVHTSSNPTPLVTNGATVVQTPSTVSIVSGNSQSATINSAFSAALKITVKDAAGVAIPSYSAVIFASPTVSNAPSATFSNGLMAITGTTDSNGQLSESITANGKAGSYSVTATAGSAQASFSLTNTTGTPSSIAVSSGSGQSANDTSAFPSSLVAYVTDGGGNPVPGASVTFTAPSQTGPSVTFAGGVNTAITNNAGLATSAAMTANAHLGTYSVTAATAGAGQTTFQLTNTLGTLAQLVVTTPSSSYGGVPIQFTVTAEDAGGNLEAGINDTLHFTSSDGAASLQSDAPLVSGAGTFTATFNSTGIQTIKASDATASLSGTSAGTNVGAIPSLVVNTLADDAGTASNCIPNAGSSGPGNCSLRDALLEAANLTAGTITFDSTVFATPQSIQPSFGTLNIPGYTSITGPTGTTVTIEGSGSSVSPVSSTLFTVPAGVMKASIANLTLRDNFNGAGPGAIANNGALAVSGVSFQHNFATAAAGGTSLGGAIANSGMLTVSNSTFGDNHAAPASGGTGNGGAIYNAGAQALLAIANTTFSNNSATSNGGAIFNDASGAATATDSTFYANTAGAGSGGAVSNGAAGTLSVWDSTFSANQALTQGGAIFNQYSSGTPNLTVVNSIASGNTVNGNPDDISDASGNVLTVTGNVIGVLNTVATGSPAINLAPLGNYGGSTQTLLPLPGSPAICGGSTQFIPVGVSTDQRGVPNNNQPYADVNCVDSGAVQTHYSLAFSTQPSAISPATLITDVAPFQAAVTLKENGVPATFGVAIPLALNGTGTLTGNSVSTAAGLANYSALKISASGSNDSLTAHLTLNGSLSTPLVLSATSAPFVVNAPPLGWAAAVLDASTRGTTVAQGHDFVVTGGAADPHDGSPVQQVQVLVDGTALGNATLGLPTTAFATAYSNPAYATAGWTFTHAASGLSLGTHTLTAVAYDSLGLSMTVARETFTVAAGSSGPPVGWAVAVQDAATLGTTVAQAHNFLVTGGAADPHDGSPVQQVQVLVDGTALGNATLGLATPALATAYNNPAYATGGWTFTHAASGLSVGTHTLTAIAYDSVGLSTTIARETFTVAAASSGPPIGWAVAVIDANTRGTTVAQAHDFLVTGGAADPNDGSPVQQVQVLVDGTAVGNATLGIATPALATAYNNPAYATGGWTFTHAASGLSLGTHTLTVVAYDSVGLSTTIARETFTVAAASSGPPIGWAVAVVDASTRGTAVAQAHNFLVTGGAADPHDGSPVQQVQVLVDGIAVGNATLGTATPALATAYSNPAYATAGWTFTHAASGLSLGTHTLTVVAYDSLGLSTTIARETFTVD